jgi:hypothetical protein
MKKWGRRIRAAIGMGLFVTGIIFSGILVGIEGRRGFDRTSLSRFAGWGAASGLLLSGIFVVGAAAGAPNA